MRVKNSGQNAERSDMKKEVLVEELKAIAFSIEDLLADYENSFSTDEKDTAMLQIEDFVKELKELIEQIN